MALSTLLLMSTLVFGGGPSPMLAEAAQERTGQLSLEAFFMHPPKGNAPTRLWLKIINRTGSNQVLCRASWGYAWLSDTPGEKPVVWAKASLHGCGDDDHDPFWLLLPGESRFDSYEVTGPSSLRATLDIDVDVMRYAAGASGPGEKVTLSWKGSVADAIALVAKLIGQ